MEYVYALQTRVHEIDGHKVGVAEFRYKPYSRGSDAQLNERMYKTTCARRVKHFETNPLPEFHVVGRVREGAEVFKTKAACFDDSDGLGKANIVGTIIKNGRKYGIKFDEPK